MSDYTTGIVLDNLERLMLQNKGGRYWAINPSNLEAIHPRPIFSVGGNARMIVGKMGTMYVCGNCSFIGISPLNYGEYV